MYLNVHKAAVRCVSRNFGEKCVLTSLVLFVSPLWHYVFHRLLTFNEPTFVPILLKLFSPLDRLYSSIHLQLFFTRLYTLTNVFKGLWYLIDLLKEYCV